MTRWATIKYPLATKELSTLYFKDGDFQRMIIQSEYQYIQSRDEQDSKEIRELNSAP